MMKQIKYLLFLLPFFLVACGEDEPEQNLFSNIAVR